MTQGSGVIDQRRRIASLFKSFQPFTVTKLLLLLAGVGVNVSS
jgi:hypothetical protein